MAYWLEILPKDAVERVLWLESEAPQTVEAFESIIGGLRLEVHNQSAYGERFAEVFSYPTNSDSRGG